jgi:Xaa-Pro aminopeptidase
MSRFASVSFVLVFVAGVMAGGMWPAGPAVAQDASPSAEAQAQIPEGYAPEQSAPMDPAMPEILPMRRRAEVVNDVLEERLAEVVPMVMRRAGVDMWIVSAREYNEDPVIETMLPATWQSARRRTMLVFVDHGEGSEKGENGVERMAIARYDVGELFQSAWEKEEQPDQWARLAEVVREHDPQSIAVNRSETFALADGMTDTEYAQLRDALPQTYRSRLTSDDRLAIGWLETRTETERTVYPQVVRIAHAIIADGLSEQAIQPGVTTTADVEWWYRDRIRELGFTAWFHPSVSVQRAGQGEDGDFSSDADATTIRPGDLLHVDFGITYLRLHTDTQQHAYVLKPGETEAPEGLQEGLRIGNRLQDVLTDEFATGRTGNEVLASALEKAKAEGIRPTIYTHPIGHHGHGAGPLIGLWDQQGGVPGRGDYPLHANTAYSIELNAEVSIPEWNGQDVLIKLEEDALFTGDGVRYLDGRQTDLYLVPRR